jgi:hypothetical protein
VLSLDWALSIVGGGIGIWGMGWSGLKLIGHEIAGKEQGWGDIITIRIGA